MHASLFVYGTLMFAEIMQAVCGRVPASRTAWLPGHRCRLLRDEVYPGLVPYAGEQVEGIVYTGLTAAELHRLDAYEGAGYLRSLCTVQGPEAHAMQAWVYLTAPAQQTRLSTTPWDAGHFARHHLQAYLDAL